MLSAVAWLPVTLVPLNNPGGRGRCLFKPEEGCTEWEMHYFLIKREKRSPDSPPARCTLGPSLILMSSSKSHLLMRNLMVTD